MSLNNTTSIADVSNVGPLDSLKAQIDVLYIPLGLALSVCSTLLFGTIVCHEALRDMKEYLVIAGLALADGLSGLATAFAGGYRTYLRLFGLTYQAVSRRHCMLMPHNLIWNISDVLQCFMLLAVSLDRFFIVLVPLHYLGWGLSYAYTLIGSIYLGTILQALFFMAMSYPHTELDQIAECRTKHAFFRDHHAIRKSARVAAALSSIAIYGGVILAYRRRIAATAKNGNVDQAELSFQRKLTKTTDSTEFTNEWAHVLQKLVDGAASPPTVKELTLAFKHKAFRYLNVLQRLLAAAQNDHYALFRTVEFLRKTHNIPLLLKLVSKQPELSSAQRKLINLLDDYLKKDNLSSLF